MSLSGEIAEEIMRFANRVYKLTGSQPSSIELPYNLWLQYHGGHPYGGRTEVAANDGHILITRKICKECGR